MLSLGSATTHLINSVVPARLSATYVGAKKPSRMHRAPNEGLFQLTPASSIVLHNSQLVFEIRWQVLVVARQFHQQRACGFGSSGIISYPHPAQHAFPPDRHSRYRLISYHTPSTVGFERLFRCFRGGRQQFPGVPGSWVKFCELLSLIIGPRYFILGQQGFYHHGSKPSIHLWLIFHCRPYHSE